MIADRLAFYMQFSVIGNLYSVRNILIMHATAYILLCLLKSLHTNKLSLTNLMSQNNVYSI